MLRYRTKQLSDNSWAAERSRDGKFWRPIAVGQTRQEVVEKCETDAGWEDIVAADAGKPEVEFEIDDESALQDEFDYGN